MLCGLRVALLLAPYMCFGNLQNYQVSGKRDIAFSLKHFCTSVLGTSSPLNHAISALKVNCMGKEFELDGFCAKQKKVIAAGTPLAKAYVSEDRVICSLAHKVQYTLSTANHQRMQDPIKLCEQKRSLLAAQLHLSDYQKLPSGEITCIFTAD